MRRKLSVSTVLLLMVFLVGCTGAVVLDPAEISAYEPLPNNQWGVTLSVRDIEPNKLTLVCERSSASELVIRTNSVFKIYHLQDSVWIPYERTDGEFGYKVWDETFYEISEKGPLLLEADWMWLYGELPAGEYLVMKRFFVDESQDAQKAPEIFFAFAEFVIEE